jgi:FtsH-binding integral membrane protein
MNMTAFSSFYSPWVIFGQPLGIAVAVAALLILSPSAETLKNVLIPLLFVGAMIVKVHGGFVTGWIAKHDQIKNAFALATLDLILTETTVQFSRDVPVLSLLEGIITALLATLCGGYLAKLAFGEE